MKRADLSGLDQELELKGVNYFNLDKLGIDETKNAVSGMIRNSEKMKYIFNEVDVKIENNSESIRNLLIQAAQSKDINLSDYIKTGNLTDLVDKTSLNSVAANLNTSESNAAIADELANQVEYDSPLYKQFQI
jgi:hypothetical protein